MFNFHKLIILYLCLAIALTYAEVSTQWALSAQLPSIGHPGQPFSWTFSAATFTSASDQNLTYEAVGLPEWASFDSERRSFYGTPAAIDVGTTTIMMAAKDMGRVGKEATDSFELKVLSQPEPVLNHPLSLQLPTASTLGPSSILSDGSQHIPLGWSFSIGFDGDTFTVPDGSEPNIDARLSDGSGLPSWLHFADMTLWGQAPTVPNSAEVRIEVVVTASNRKGFGGPSSNVVLVVTSSELTLGAPLRIANVTAGALFHYMVPTTGLQLDGHQSPSSNPITIHVGDLSEAALSWLTFDSDSMSFSGTAPLSGDGQLMTPEHLTVPITFVDSFNNSVPTNLSIDVYPSAFTLQLLPNVFAEASETFNISLAQFLRVQPLQDGLNVTASYDPPDASAWLSFNSTSVSMTGCPPLNAISDRVLVRLNAEFADQIGGQTSTATFYIATTSSKGASANNEATNGLSKGLSKTGKLALTASLGIAGGLMAMIFLIIFCRRCCAIEERDLVDEHVAAPSSCNTTLRGGSISPTSSFDNKGKPRRVSPSALTSDKLVHVSLDDSGRASPVEPAASSCASAIAADRPKQNSVFATLWGKKGPAHDVESHPIAMSGPALDTKTLQSPTTQQKVQRSRSHRSIRAVGNDNERPSSRESRHSWADNLFYSDSDVRSVGYSSDEQCQPVPHDDTCELSTTETVAKRYAGDDAASKIVSSFMRHRSAHLHISPAFQAAGSFETTTASDHVPLQRGFDVPGNGSEDDTAAFQQARPPRSISGLRTMRVSSHQPSFHERDTRNCSQHVEPGDLAQDGVFDDAEFDDGRASSHDGHASILSRSSGDNELAWHDDGRSRRLSAQRSPEQISSSRASSSASSQMRPEDTMRVISSTPIRSASSDFGFSEGRRRSSAEQRALPSHALEQEEFTGKGEYVRIRVRLSEPPPMYGGAPGSPGKRSGRRVTYVPQYEDADPSIEPCWPDWLHWLHWDPRMYELSGTVPSNPGIATPGFITIAIFACPEKATVPTSPTKRIAQERTRSLIAPLGDSSAISTRIKLWIE